MKRWISGTKNGVPFFELIDFLLSPTYIKKAKDRIKSIKEEGPYLCFNFYDFDYPLYFPKSIDIKHLFQVIAESFYNKDWHFYEALRYKVKKDDIVLDCGAGEGLFSFSVINRCKKVYAIEPLPVFCESMKLTFANFGNLEVMPYALSDTCGNAVISDAGIQSALGTSSQGISVPVTTIDTLFLEKGIPVTYIKADLEGYELKVLHGAREIIKKYKPIISVTTYHNKGDAALISDFLRSLSNYKIETKGISAETGDPIMLHACVG